MNINLDSLFLDLQLDSFEKIKEKFSNPDYTILEDDKIFLIRQNNQSTSRASEILQNGSHIYIKDGLKYITSFNKIRYINDDAKKYIAENEDKWDEFIIQQSFEGPCVQVFNYDDKWYVCNEDSLSCSNVYGNSSKTVLEYFTDTGKCDFNKLNKNICYHFILLHNKLKHIVQYNNLGYDFKELVLLKSVENNIIIDNSDTELFIKPIIYHFSCFDELEATLEKITYDNAVYRRISTEGYLISHNGILLKLQTEIYSQINILKPLEKNNYQVFLELYQKDKLNDVLPYISKYSNEIIHRINMSMRTLSREILNIYHTTRKKKNCNVYDSLPDNYKKILYGIHGNYIKGRKRDFINGREIEGKDTKSITVHDIYYYLKSLPPNQLRQIYFDRIDVMKNAVLVAHINFNCIYSLTQARLMA